MARKVLLPIDPLLPEILSILESGKNLILQASPGSGKTTRVPPALLASKFLPSHQEILVLVPRRLAAKLAAFRVAEEMGERVGLTVGYQFRFENVTGPKTRLKFLTEGLLLRQLISDPLLSTAGLVILDEFHERHLHSDVALAYLKWLQKNRRPDLRIVVMSATLEMKPLGEYLENAALLSKELPPHPIEVHYASHPSSEFLEAKVRRAVQEAVHSPFEGDLLVFLPGMAEIRRAAQSLRETFGKSLEILPLHGDLPREEQEKVFQKFDRPKVILATNIAESSLTIEGVRTVIDSGLHRLASYSWWNGVPALKTRPIAKASAIQRAGRAGRQGPGRCFRLYPKSDFEGRPAFERPEIQRADLAQILLEIKALGRALSDFPWFEAPASAALEVAVELLFHLGAITASQLDAPLTPLGLRMAQIPLHPRLARMLLTAEQRGCLEKATTLAALISEDDLAGLDALAEVEHPRLAEAARKLKGQLAAQFRNSATSSPTKPKGPWEKALAYAVLTGFPDRVAKKREKAQLGKKKGELRRGHEVDLIFSDGGSGCVEESGAMVDKDYFIILNVQELQRPGQVKSQLHVRSLCPIDPECLLDLDSHFFEETNELSWDARVRRVVQLSRIRYGQLVLSESREKPKDAEAALSVLLKEGLGLELKGKAWNLTTFLQALSHLTDAAPLTEALARLKLFAQYHPQAEFPKFEGEDLAAWVRDMFRDLLGLAEAELQQLPERAVQLLPSEWQSKLLQECPTQLALPRGRRVKVHYSLDRPPWIESRLQDFFGMKQVPKLLGGRVALTVQLLAPNQRPVQVTNDLESFWKNAYPQLRKELGRKYPKHKWPEDPLK